MYTPSQVSEMLSIPPSTLRRLASQLKSLLSPQHSRHRHYNEQDIALLKRARELTGEGASIKEIHQALTVASEPGESAPAPGDTLALVPTIAGELERIDSAYRQVLSELEKMRQEREGERARLEALERWLSLPWWKRLFNKPQ